MWQREETPTSRTGAPPAQAADRLRSPERRPPTCVGASVTFKGEIISGEDLVIDGRVEGTITASDHHLIIAAGATILASLHARTITIGGAVTGDVRATEKIDIRETGSVDGDLQAPRLAVHDGGVLRGRVEVNAAAQDDAAPRVATVPLRPSRLESLVEAS